MFQSLRLLYSNKYYIQLNQYANDKVKRAAIVEGTSN